MNIIIVVQGTMVLKYIHISGTICIWFWYVVNTITTSNFIFKRYGVRIYCFYETNFNLFKKHMLIHLFYHRSIETFWCSDLFPDKDCYVSDGEPYIHGAAISHMVTRIRIRAKT